MTPLGFLMISLGVGVLAGCQLVLRGRSENSITGLNIALICTVTGLSLFGRYYGIGFGRDVAFILIFPGIIGSIIYARFLRGGVFR
ncbi:hypothetical protein ACFLRF_02400 [Candidatus Altiarchaeota archaeon]